MAEKNMGSFSLGIESAATINVPSIDETGDPWLSPFGGQAYHRRRAWSFAGRIYKHREPTEASTRDICLFLYHLALSGSGLAEILPVESDRARIERAVARYEAEGCLALARLHARDRIPLSHGLVAEDIRLMYEHLSVAGLKLEAIGSDFAEVKELIMAEKLAEAGHLNDEAAKDKTGSDVQ